MGKKDMKKKKRVVRLKKKTAAVYLVIMTVMSITLVVSVVMLVKMAVGYISSRKEYADIERSAIEVYVPPSETDEPDENEYVEYSGDSRPDDPDAEPTPYMISGDIPWERDETLAEEVGITVKWEELRRKNKEIKAWLYCEGTNISYPVLQTKDNEYYISHNANKKEDDTGALFFDFSNSLTDERENWIIYGHRRNDRSMFGNLARFGGEAFYKQHSMMYLLMPDRAYRIRIFACRTVKPEFKYFNTWFGTEMEFSEYIERALQQSYWQPSFEVTTEHPIITLATCSKYTGENDPRLLVHGVLERIDYY